MRIISGKYKGKRLMAPRNLPVRPTTDFAKEGLFNILNNRVHFSDISVLDLFAGTGNISFEFASRGTTELTAVDIDHGCTQYIKKISDELEFNIQVIKSDVFSFLEKNRQPFDIIFADAPYVFDHTQFAEIVSRVQQHALLKDDGFLIIEHSKHTDLSSLPGYSESRKYGGSVFSFFES
tara:strand:+ start:57282 stop:57818 length:537 start_codon:yes stop_codon:yes gene_type:complete